MPDGRLRAGCDRRPVQRRHRPPGSALRAAGIGLQQGIGTPSVVTSRVQDSSLQETSRVQEVLRETVGSRPRAIAVVDGATRTGLAALGTPDVGHLRLNAWFYWAIRHRGRPAAQSGPAHRWQHPAAQGFLLRPVTILRNYLLPLGRCCCSCWSQSDSTPRPLRCGWSARWWPSSCWC